MNQFWQFWNSGLNEETVQAFTDIGEQYPIANAALGFDGSSKNENFRSSEIRWVDPNDPANVHLVNALWYFAKQANKNAFGFDITQLNDIQYTTYYGSQNGKYDWHHDTFWANPTTMDRKLSIVIQLSDPSEYVGGDFEIDPQYPQFPADEIKKKGAVMVFPSFLLHRVTPVTSGVRRSLVSWIEGPKFK